MKRISAFSSLALTGLLIMPLQGCVTDDQEPAQETVVAKRDNNSTLPPDTDSDLQAEQVDSPVIKDKKAPALTPDDIEADNDPMKIGFETARWDLSDVALSRIQDVADKLKADTSLKLKIDGHCDERGSDGYNQELSEKRANAVKKQLVKDGISAKRLTAEGFGRKKMLMRGHSEKVYSHNRRVEMIFSN